MAHNLTQIQIGDEIKTAFLYNEETVGTPWHGLGTAHQGPFMIPWAVEQIGADYLCNENSVYRKDGTRVEGWKELAHPNGYTYQMVTTTYEKVDFVDYAAAFSVAAGEDAKTPRGNTIGMLGADASEFFVSCESTFAKINKKNEIKRFMVFLTGHTGKGCRIFGTDVNPVCQNTINAGLRLAESQKTNLVMLAHKTGVNERIRTMARMIALAQEIDAKALEAYVALAERTVTVKEVTDYVTDLFPWDKDTKGPTPDRVIDKRLAVEQAFAHPVVNGKPTGSDQTSAYGLLNAATWWIDHGQAKGDWGRTAFSPACAENRQKAFDLAVALV